MNPTISAPAMNIWNLSYFVTGTYTNMKSGCHHHQIGMDYLWGAFFKMATIEVNLRFPYDHMTIWPYEKKIHMTLG